MSRRTLVVVGAGGFGRETVDVVVAINEAGSHPIWEFAGVYDDSPSEQNYLRLMDRKIALLGPLPSKPTRTDVHFVIAVGDPKIRRQISAKLEGWGWTPATLIHPDAIVGTQPTIAPGTIICGGVQISTNVRLGRHTHINPNATIGHDALLEDFVSVNPGATVSGEVHIHEEVLLGANSVVLQGLSVLAGATVGAAACVIADVDAYTVVVGIPARRLRQDPSSDTDLKEGSG